MSVAAQYVKQIGGSHKTGLQLASAGFYHLRQRICGFLRILGKPEMHGKNMLCLRPVICEGFAEGIHDPLIQPLILTYILSQHPAGLYHKGGGIGIEGRGYKIRPAGSLIASHRRVQAEPVLIMLPAGPKVRILCAIGNEADIFFHTVKLLSEDFLIPVGQIYLPGADGSGVIPGSPAASHIKGGDHMAY